MPQTNAKRPTKWAELDNSLQGPWAFRAKEQVICLCEGSHLNCWREDPAKQKDGNGLAGLHSNWVGEHGTILAMARPWQESISKYNLVDAFVRNNIGMILNLQEVGEHASCGPGVLRSSGFSYDPDTFMAARVGFYNFSWRDMGVPDLVKMMDIVQVMDYVTSVEKRKIAVHCHAGLGRTGLAIACYFVYARIYDAATAVTVVRRYRPGALQTSQQVLFVSVFEQYLSYLRCIFRSVPSTAGPHTVSLSRPHEPARHNSMGNLQAANNNPQTAAAPHQSAPQQGTSSAAAATEVFPSGLTIVRASGKGQGLTQGLPSSHSMPNLAAGFIPEGGGLPWNAQMYMIPTAYSITWQPPPPSSYDEALYRQQCHVHGPSRRAYINLHWFVKEAAFAVIEGAKFHKQAGGTTFSKIVCDALAAGRRDVSADLAKVKSMANSTSCQPLTTVPLPVVLRALEDFFATFDPSLPSLSPEGLRHMSKVYKVLPFASSPGVPEPLQVASAMHLLAPLAARDHELLVLFSAMMRNVAKASMPGCEEELVHICRWLVQLVLSRLASKPAAEEAVMSFLWCLMRNDAAFAAAIQCKKQKFDKRQLPGPIPLPPPAPAPPTNVAAPHSAGSHAPPEPPKPRVPMEQRQGVGQEQRRQQPPQASAQPLLQQQQASSQTPLQPPAEADASLPKLPPLAPSSSSPARKTLPAIAPRARSNQVAPLPDLPPGDPAVTGSPKLSANLPVLPAIPSRSASKLGPAASQPETGASAQGQASGKADQQSGAGEPQAGAAGGDKEPDAQVGPPTEHGVITKALLQNLPPGIAIGPTADSHVHDVWA